MDPIENESIEYDWSEIEPAVADSSQRYVLIAHAILGVVISVLSFSDGLVSWGVGLGAMTPVLLVITGLFYKMATGINWYRDEFIPYVTRIKMIPEFETDRFLTYKKRNRILMLLSNYISLVITQYIWTQILNVLLSFPCNLGDMLEALAFIFGAMLFLHVFLTIIIFTIFTSVSQSGFSDVRYIIDIEDKMTVYFKEKKKMEKKESELKNEAYEEVDETEAEVSDQ